MSARPRVVILGGGISGLSLAARLGGRFDVAVVEAEESAGGMARTLVRGDFRLDLGPHPLYASEPANEPVVAGLRERLGDALREIPRSSAAYFNGRYFGYPLKMRDILSKLSPLEVPLYGLSFLRARGLFALGRRGRKNFAAWVAARYGHRIYALYFRKYTEKAWGVAPEKLSAVFAAERVPDVRLGETVWELLTGKKPAGAKDHPHNPQNVRSYMPRGGAGAIAGLLEKDARAAGAEIRTGARAVGLTVSGGRITGVEIEERGRRDVRPCDFLASTIPLPGLVAFLAPPPKSLEIGKALPHSGLALLFLFYKGPRLLRHNWIYFPEAVVPFNRVSEIKNYAPDCAPEGRTVLCLEFPVGTTAPGAAPPPPPDVGAAVRTLDALGIAPADRLEDSFLVRLPHAYCLWLNGFEKPLREARAILGGYRNLISFGRQGEFQYYNMDHCLRRGEAAEAAVRAYFEGRGD